MVLVEHQVVRAMDFAKHACQFGQLPAAGGKGKPDESPCRSRMQR